MESCEFKNCYGKIETDTVKGQRQSWGSRKNKDVFVSVVCVYATTARATPAVKSKFSTELQDTLDKVPQHDVFMMLDEMASLCGEDLYRRKK